MNFADFKTYWKEYLFHPACFYIILSVGLMPIFLLAYFYNNQFVKLDEARSKIEVLHKRSLLSKSKKNKEEEILSFMKGADPYYLDKYIESLSFLDPELKKWQRLCTEKPLPAIEQRLEFLSGESNKLLFAEGEIITEGAFREIEEKQKHPIEVNEDDLKKILSLLEGTKISNYSAPEKHPQIFIKQFDLTKKTLPDIKEKVFVISMQLIKRELLTEQHP